LIERPAVTHKSALDDLWKTTAEADDGNVLTAGGVTSGLDLAVHLVEREFGATVAEEVRTEMEYEPRGTVYRG
jgi:transcriptional regulator GlxA family with amidase domain